ncbi:MAG TPA: hypothetical protein VNE58_17010 [Casimicrobiaceae bacterium]|nr:hypothetical protein [Casimicrobiaceae bacterium]
MAMNAVWERVRRRAVMRLPFTIGEAAVAEPATLCAFDLLSLDGRDMRVLPLFQRKDALRGLISAVPGLPYVNDLQTHGEALFATAVKLQQEGIVAKLADSPYKAGRQAAWRKIKNRQFPRQEALALA